MYWYRAPPGKSDSKKWMASMKGYITGRGVPDVPFVLTSVLVARKRSLRRGSSASQARKGEVEDGSDSSAAVDESNATEGGESGSKTNTAESAPTATGGTGSGWNVRASPASDQSWAGHTAASIGNAMDLLRKALGFLLTSHGPENDSTPERKVSDASR